MIVTNPDESRFIYTGEVSIPQHELQDFLRTAELLEIKGLLKSPTATAAAAAAAGGGGGGVMALR